MRSESQPHPFATMIPSQPEWSVRVPTSDMSKHWTVMDFQHSKPSAGRISPRPTRTERAVTAAPALRLDRPSRMPVTVATDSRRIEMRVEASVGDRLSGADLREFHWHRGIGSNSRTGESMLSEMLRVRELLGSGHSHTVCGSSMVAPDPIRGPTSAITPASLYFGSAAPVAYERRLRVRAQVRMRISQSHGVRQCIAVCARFSMIVAGEGCPYAQR